MAQTDAQRRWYERNRERILERQRVERAADPEKNPAQCREQYARHREKRLASTAAYQREHREAANASKREHMRRRRAAGVPDWRELNPARHRERDRARRAAWTSDQRQAHADRQLARRARKASAFVEDVDRGVLFDRDEGRCGICGVPVDPASFHVDHVIPLARGGEHSYGNTQVAHPKCNLRKGAGRHLES